MKRIPAFLLIPSLLVLLFCCLPAAVFAEDSYTGTWHLDRMEMDTLSVNASAMGVEATLELQEDGSARYDVSRNGKKSSSKCTWEKAEGGIVLKEKKSSTRYLYVNGELVTEGDIKMVFTRETHGTAETSLPEEVPAESAARFNGDWVVQRAAAAGITIGSTDPDPAKTTILKIRDGTVNESTMNADAMRVDNVTPSAFAGGKLTTVRDLSGTDTEMTFSLLADNSLLCTFRSDGIDYRIIYVRLEEAAGDTPLSAFEGTAAESVFSFDVRDDDTAVITQYNGESQVVSIPETLGGKKVTAIAGGAFRNVKAGGAVTIPAFITELTGNPFACYGSLPDIRLAPDHPVFEIADGGLYNKKNGTLILCMQRESKGTFKIRQGTPEIADYAFYNCGRLTGVRIPDSVRRIGSYAFYRCSRLKKVSVPDSVTELGTNTFMYCEGLKEAHLPPRVTVLRFTFEGCKKLQKVNLPEGVTEMMGTFQECSSLKTVKLPSTLKVLERYTFMNCDSLSGVDLPSGLEKIGEDVFSYCPKLKKLRFPNGSARFEAVDNVLFDREEKRLICYPAGRGGSKYDVPDGTEIIELHAFAGSKRLSFLTFPDSVREIRLGAMDSCAGLKQVTLPAGLEKLESNVFFGCKKLSSVTLPDSLKFIGWGAFCKCTALKSIRVPEGVTHIDDSVFSGCEKLQSVVLPAGVTEIGKDVFKDCPKLKVTVPENSPAEQYCKDNSIPFTTAR